MQKMWFLLCVVVAALGLRFSAAHAGEWKFDFQPAGETPAAGYTQVTESTIYNVGTGYGFVNQGLDKGSRYRPAYTSDTRLLGFVYTEGQFVLDLANGDYYVTFAIGDAQYNRCCRIEVEGVEYGQSEGWPYPQGEPIYLLNATGNVWQYIVPIQESQQGIGHQVVTQGETFTGLSQFLYLDRKLVTVSDGQLTVASTGVNIEDPNDPNDDWADDAFNFLVVSTEATPPTCAELIGLGYQLRGDIDEDCRVGFSDFAGLADMWMQCDDPNDPNCNVHW
ncbi:MAG: hypothetical protein ABIG61_03005 [Planctomycetota bacterium]